MNFNSNRNASTSTFKASKQSPPSQLGPGFITADKNSGVHEQYYRINNAAIPSEATPNISVMNLHKSESSTMEKHCQFGDKNTTPSPERITGKRSQPPEDIVTPASPQKKRCVDAAQALPPVGPASSSRAAANIRPKMPDLLPIQRDSWYYLPEMWDYCGPDGKPIKERRWSPNKDGGQSSQLLSDRLHQNGDRENATAATVATWVELNRLRARYQELVTEFHSGPLLVHHLADRESEHKLEAITHASTEFEYLMAKVGKPSAPQPQFFRAAPAEATKPTITWRAMIAPQMLPVSVSPQDTLLRRTLRTEVGSAPPPSRAALSAIPLATSATPYSPKPPTTRAPAAIPALPITHGQQAPPVAPLDVSSASKGPSRRRRAPPTPDHIDPPAVLSTSTGPFYFFTTGGQFRFNPAGEARFKLLIVQGDYDEAFGMLPEGQQCEHLTSPGAISAFRQVHPQPEKGGKEGNAEETELWVCRAKVKIERRELPKAKDSDLTDYELDIVYSDEPCNGAASTHSNMVRHKKRTHLGRLYQSNTTQKKQGGETGK